MNAKQASLLSIGAFVLLWGSAAIFTKWGLHHGATIPFLEPVNYFV